MISLEEYKKYLIETYRYEIDNCLTKKEERKQTLEKRYGDELLSKIILDTYNFLKDVLNSETIEDGYCDIPIEENTTSFISLNLTGGYYSDTLYTDNKGRIISKYITKQFMGDYFDIDVIDKEKKYEDEGLDINHYLYMKNFPKNINELRRILNYHLNEPINVIFLDIGGVLETMHDVWQQQGKKVINKNIERRIALLADICKSYKTKIVMSSSAKDAINEETGLVSDEAICTKEMFNLFEKYGIECIGRTPNVERKITESTILSMWKDDEIRLYLFRHPEIVYYCVLDDDDTKNMLHWKVSDLDKVREHLVTTLYYSNNPEEEGLLPKHKEEVGKVLQKENEIRRMFLRKYKKSR